MGIFASVGFGMGLVSLIRALRIDHLNRPFYFPLFMMIINVLLLVLALFLYRLFLRPLDHAAQKFPKFSFQYVDPENRFTLKGPAGWTYENIGTKYESGLRLRPQSQNQYMGISEVVIFVRKLDSKPRSPDDFLRKMADQWIKKNEQGKKSFDFSMAPLSLLNGEQGLIASLEAERFWVPIKQVSILGFKKGNYLCSVAAVGLKNHANLSRVMCLGLLESLQVHSKEN